MKLITASELANKDVSELSAIFQKVSQKLARTDAHTLERANALGSLENVSRAIAARQLPKP